MSIEVIWDDEEKTIIRWIIQGKLEWADYEQANQISREMCTSVGHAVYTLFDAREIVVRYDSAECGNVCSDWKDRIHPDVGPHILPGLWGIAVRLYA